MGSVGRAGRDITSRMPSMTISEAPSQNRTVTVLQNLLDSGVGNRVTSGYLDEAVYEEAKEAVKGNSSDAKPKPHEERKKLPTRRGTEG